MAKKAKQGKGKKAKANAGANGGPETLHVGLLIDESGSMSGTEPAVIGGINELVGELAADRNDKVRVRVSLAMFDLHGSSRSVRVKFAGIPLEEVRPLEPGEYRPRGATPLNDAVVKTVAALDRNARKGDRVMLVILTDGFENASETSTADVRKLIRAKERAGWELIYLGANQDSWAESQQLGIDPVGKSFDFDASAAGTGAALKHAARRTKLYRDDRAAYEASAASQPRRVEREERD